MPCVLSGIDGIFGAENNEGNYSYFFDRATTGTSKSVTRPATIYTKIGNDSAEDICIIWIGQNLVKWVDSSNNTSEKNLQRTIQDAKAIIRSLKTLDKRYLVISKPSGDNAANNKEDDIFYSEFGDRFIPIRQYITTPIYAGDGTTIINCYGLQDAGISPTAGDLTEIANGSIPQSFRNDSVHWKAAGYEVLAKVIYRKLNELGWV
jgi:lysophospholipase L1-like esterase